MATAPRQRWQLHNDGSDSTTMAAAPLDRPDRRCAINNKAKSVGDQMTAIEVWLPNTMERPALPLS